MAQIRGVTVMPWILSNDEGGDSEIASGGLVLRAIAGGTLLVGDAVILTANGTVNKDTVTGNHLKACGIVLGGRNFGRNMIQRKLDVGAQAALVNQEVYVCITGLCYGVAQAAIAQGAYVRPDTTTAGRLLTGTVTTDVAAGDTGKMIGKAWEAAAGAASVFLVLVSLQ